LNVEVCLLLEEAPRNSLACDSMKAESQRPAKEV